MKSDLTDITLVVDRSGSMEQVREDAEGGVNSFIAQQAKEPGEALLTLVQFDTEYEFLHQGVPITEVPRYELVPRGMTALLDAVGRAINETGERLTKMEEQDRPGPCHLCGNDGWPRKFQQGVLEVGCQGTDRAAAGAVQLAFHVPGSQSGCVCRGGKHGHPRRWSGQFRHGQSGQRTQGDRGQGVAYAQAAECGGDGEERVH